MRARLVGLGLLVIATPLHAQVRDSTYWMIGVSRSFMSGETIASRSSESGGSMQFEWRTEGRRLGIRAEVGVAQQNRYFDTYSEGAACAGCFSDQRVSHVMALTSAVYEWRQERMLRPYVIGGAGISRFAYRNTTNLTVDRGVVSGSPLRKLDHTTKETSSQLGFLTAYGLGVSANGERFGMFAEARGRAGGGLSVGERFSVGVRVRPN